ncbi:hypothetical protein BpHYR1_018121 [Brachionus plicatilis]|uniref:Uncharacterized protein n=1 Tax=Brachionus plicatilis TaxID=10195 RepID=A0A3M7PEZ3_BRAPC|nr:hypothetical protein BpHYR1_018121 [Brachionus plicatilis]
MNVIGVVHSVFMSFQIGEQAIRFKMFDVRMLGINPQSATVRQKIQFDVSNLKEIDSAFNLAVTHTATVSLLADECLLGANEAKSAQRLVPEFSSSIKQIMFNKLSSHFNLKKTRNKCRRGDKIILKYSMIIVF